MVERYKEHLIVASAKPDGGTGTYTSVASISWQEGDRRRVYVIANTPDRFNDPDSAIQFALNAARNWVDGRLR